MKKTILLCTLSLAAFSQAAGYLFAPLAHGAVLVPMSVTVFCSILAIVLLKERHGLAHAVGTGGIILGLGLIGERSANVPVVWPLWRGLCSTRSRRARLIQ